MKERILQLPGFLYQVDSKFYYLGKWICKECTDYNATDCVTMYQMSREAKEESNASMYFHKIRGYADIALEVPYNGAQVQADLETLLSSLNMAQQEALEAQLDSVQEDLIKYA